jgi:DNA-binding transcriptional MerR regulator
MSTNDDNGKRAGIPRKRYFSISEVAKLTGVKRHVLLYWTEQFSVLRPMRRQGSRRYYRRQDLMFILEIKRLIHEEGYTIQGVRQELEKRRQARSLIREIRGKLEELLHLLRR